MELWSMLCASMEGKGVWGRMDTGVCVAESLCCKRRERLPTPVLQPGEFHGLYGHKELDTTKQLSLSGE